jgi:hypothetical protein
VTVLYAESATNDYNAVYTNSLDHDTQLGDGSYDTQVTDCLPTLHTPQSEEYVMFQVAAKRVAPFSVDIVANGARLHLEVDRGAALTLISEATLWPENAPKLSASDIRLRTYMGGVVIKESTAVTVQYNGQLMEDLHLLVVEGNSPILMGREWLMRVRLDWSQLMPSERTHKTTHRHSLLY